MTSLKGSGGIETTPQDQQENNLNIDKHSQEIQTKSNEVVEETKKAEQEPSSKEDEVKSQLPEEKPDNPFDEIAEQAEIQEEAKKLDTATTAPAELIQAKEDYKEDEAVDKAFTEAMASEPETQASADVVAEADSGGRAAAVEAGRKAAEGPAGQAEKADAPAAEAAQAAADPTEVSLDGKGGDSLTMEIGGADNGVKPDLDKGVEQVTDLRKPTDTSDALDPDGAISDDQIGESVGLQDADRADDLLARGKESPLEGLGKGGDSGVPGLDENIYQESGVGDEGAPIDPEKLDQFGEQIGDEFGLHKGPGGGAPGREVDDLPGQGEMEPWNERPDLQKAAAFGGGDSRISADGKEEKPPPPPPPEEDPPPPPPPKKKKKEKPKGPKLVAKPPPGSKKKLTPQQVIGRIYQNLNPFDSSSDAPADKAADGHVGVRGTQDPEGAVETYTDTPPGVSADPMDTPLKHSDSMMQPAGDSTEGAKPRKNLKAELTGSDVDPYGQYHGDEVDVPGGLMGEKVDVDGNLVDPPDIAGGGELNTDAGVMLNTDDENRDSLDEDGSQDMKATDGKK